MKYTRLPRFDSDYSPLTSVERKKFREALQLFIVACKGYEADPAWFVWPASLRFERLTGSNALAITWSFRGPDGRATFHFDTKDGEMYVVWRRVGRHEIYKEP